MSRLPGVYPSPSWRHNRAVAFQDQTIALTSTTALVFTQPVAGEVQVRGRYLNLDPGGTSKVVKMPPETQAQGVELFLYNATGADGAVLLVQASDGAVLGIRVERGQSAHLVCTASGWRDQLQSSDATSHISQRYHLTEDFLGAALPNWLATADDSAAGAPSFGFVANETGGAFAVQMAVDNEVEIVGIFGINNLTIDTEQGPVVEIKVKVDSDPAGGSGNFAAGDKLVIGFASAYDAVPDNVVKSAWFLFGGAVDHKLRVEADDNITNIDDQDTGIVWAEGVYLTLRVDFSEMRESGVHFYAGGQLVKTLAVQGFTGNVQVYCMLRKAAAANNDHRFTVEYIDLDAGR